jgi:hypothetical protein
VLDLVPVSQGTGVVYCGAMPQALDAMDDELTGQYWYNAGYCMLKDAGCWCLSIMLMKLSVSAIQLIQLFLMPNSYPAGVSSDGDGDRQQKAPNITCSAPAAAPAMRASDLQGDAAPPEKDSKRSSQRKASKSGEAGNTKRIRKSSAGCSTSGGGGDNSVMSAIADAIKLCPMCCRAGRDQFRVFYLTIFRQPLSFCLLNARQEETGTVECCCALTLRISWRPCISKKN